ncbi:breast carcinoma amplified sequence 2 [Necator americanus]|uniref:Pre-mRNA-splicing factor SPF27 n=1 Tax=Necator americanus TaxID=51031 RepID=W2SIS5_NECAM|nr:breast carcinoma amplified sequence 2 [Necator americanus]ETN69473.1 breast carcinoma amplified sequence 2 [Necator americanus]
MLLEVLVDALPYLDTEYNDADRQTALRLIDQECKAIKNAKAQNEHLVMRQINLELMEDYAAESYLRRNRELEQLCTEAERELRKTKEQVMEIHARRKMAQLDAGRQLKELEGSWVAMVTNNYRMELANNQLAATNAQMAKRLRIDLDALEK